MRTSATITIVLLSFAAGLVTFPLSHLYDSDVEGQRLNCVERGAICVGIGARAALLKASPDLGGLWHVQCDFERPDANVSDAMMLDEVIAHGCAADNYVALFSNGKYMTAIWIKNGKVVRLDRTPAYDKGL